MCPKESVAVSIVKKDLLLLSRQNIIGKNYYKILW